MQTIELTRGHAAAVDDEDYAWLSEWHWSALVARGGHVYAARHIYENRESVLVLMHRQILAAAKGEVVDHCDGDGLNNTRDNLRLCTHAENMYNSRTNATYKGKPTASRYKGVFFDLERIANPWRARIGFDGRYIRVGSYKTEKEAAIAYNEAAILYHGEFARLNVIIENE